MAKSKKGEKTMKKKEATILVLENTGIRKWKCTECGNIQDGNVVCLKCSAAVKAFDEVPVIVPMDNLVVVEALNNVIVSGVHVEKGTHFKLSDKDPRLQDLLTRLVIKKVK